MMLRQPFTYQVPAGLDGKNPTRVVPLFPQDLGLSKIDDGLTSAAEANEMA